MNKDGDRDENEAWSRNRGGNTDGDGDKDELETRMGTEMVTGMRTGTGLKMQKGTEPGMGTGIRTGLEHSRGRGETGAQWEEQDVESCVQCQRGAKPRRAERWL